MENGILQSIILMGVAQSLFLLFLYLKKSRQGRAAKYYLFLVSAVALGLTLTYLSLQSAASIMERFLDFNLGLNFLYGPLLYLYAAYYTAYKKDISSLNGLHFLPFLTAITLLILQAAVKRPLPLLAEILWVSSHFQGLCYGLISISVLISQHKRLKQFSANSYRDRFTWLFILISMNTLTWTAAIIRFLLELYFPALPPGLSLLTPLFGILTIYVYGYFSLSHPHILEEEKAEAGEKDDGDTEFKIKLLEQMQKNELWRRDDLTLNTLSEITKIPSYRISRIINAEPKSNFFTFVNRYRVQEVQHRLEAGEALPLLDMAFEAGFNSKSTFNDAFKKITGSTPSQYRKTVRIRRIQPD